MPNRSHRTAEALRGRTLTPEKIEAARLMARYHYAVGFVNTDLYSGKSQVAKVYRAMMDKCYTEDVANDAVSGGTLQVGGGGKTQEKQDEPKAPVE